jgi:hypothetical protein
MVQSLSVIVVRGLPSGSDGLGVGLGDGFCSGLGGSFNSRSFNAD